MESGDTSKSSFVAAEITGADFQTVDVVGSCPKDYGLKGLRYAWREKPCNFKKCAVYSQENDLPGPPFVWNAPVQ